MPTTVQPAMHRRPVVARPTRGKRLQPRHPLLQSAAAKNSTSANVSNTCYIIAWMEMLAGSAMYPRRHPAPPRNTDVLELCALCALRECICRVDDKTKEADASPWRMVLEAEPHLHWGHEQDVTELWYMVTRSIEQHPADAARWARLLQCCVTTCIPHDCPTC